LYYVNGLGYQKCMFNSSELGLTLEDKTVDLLGNGMAYWLGGCGHIVNGDNEYNIQGVYIDGKVVDSTARTGWCTSSSNIKNRSSSK
jgi:hypothetical protein